MSAQQQITSTWKSFCVSSLVCTHLRIGKKHYVPQTHLPRYRVHRILIEGTGTPANEHMQSQSHGITSTVFQKSWKYRTKPT